jgi:sialidase-1
MTRRGFALGLATARAKAQKSPVAPIELFRQGENGVHTYRIPALLETRDGTLLAIADARFDSNQDLPGRIALILRRSTDRGKTWTPFGKVAKSPSEPARRGVFSGRGPGT